MGLTDNDPRCIRCSEDFPVGKPESGARMGELQPLKKFALVRRVMREFNFAKNEPGTYLCGNCYFDLTD